MAKKFKDYYNKRCAQMLADKFQLIDPDFPSEKFVSVIAREIRGKEFHDRLDIFSAHLKDCLAGEYQNHINLFNKILGPKLTTDSGMFIHGWWLWPIGRYIQNNSLANLRHFKQSLVFIYELTQRFTGEFAVRPILEMKPKQSLAIIEGWSIDPSVHVRRLASEGIRIKLPWAKKLDLFKDYEKECFQILSNLMESSEKFVQKSVGNNINDLYKTRPEQAEKFIKKWTKSQHPSVRWILKHGQRNQ